MKMPVRGEKPQTEEMIWRAMDLHRWQESNQIVNVFTHLGFRVHGEVVPKLLEKWADDGHIRRMWDRNRTLYRWRDSHEWPYAEIEETAETVESGPTAELVGSRCAQCILEDNAPSCTHPDVPAEEGANETPFDGSLASWCPLLKRPLTLKAKKP